MQGSIKYKIQKATAEGQFFHYAGLILSYPFRKAGEKIGIALGQIPRNKLSKSSKTNPNKIVFLSFQGDYTCNPKYITEELLRQNVDAEIVWAGRDKSIYTPGAFPYGVKTVELYSYEMMREIASAKIIISNSVEYQKLRLPIRPDQVVIQTWHGSLGIKRFDRDHNSGKQWIKAADYNGKTTKYCISNSAFEDDVFTGTFWPNSQILRYGHPRNDILFELDKEKCESIKRRLYKKLGISPDTKIVLYGPTFRDAHNFDCYNIKPELIFRTLKERFGGEWALINRFHPTVRTDNPGLITEENVFDMTDYPDIQELMLIADIAITDYSSWIFDFMLTRRPGFIFATDIEKYNNERGFYFSLESTPFPIARSAEQLAENISKFNADEYAKGVEAFLTEKGCVEDGHAAKRVVEIIKKELQ